MKTKLETESRPGVRVVSVGVRIPLVWAQREGKLGENIVGLYVIQRDHYWEGRREKGAWGQRLCPDGGIYALCIGVT